FKGAKLVLTQQRKRDISAARGAVSAQRFRAARDLQSKATEGWLNDQRKVTAELQYRELMQGATKEERESGEFKLVRMDKKSYATEERGMVVGTVMAGFDYSSIMSSLFTADNHLAGGRVAAAKAETKDFKTKLLFGYQTQKKLNEINR